MLYITTQVRISNVLFKYSFFNISGFKVFNSFRTQVPFTLSVLWWCKWKDVEMVSHVTKEKACHIFSFTPLLRKTCPISDRVVPCEGVGGG